MSSIGPDASGPAGPQHAGDPAYPARVTAMPGNPTARPRLRTVLVYGVVVVGFLLSASALAQELEAGLGLQVTVLAALFAAIPLLVVVPLFLWLDRYEAEPPRLLVFAFAWGAVCAAAGALFLNTEFMLALQQTGSPDPEAVASVVSAPIVEEGLKGLGVLLVVLLRRREFGGVVDGIVYGGIVGAGFAFSENIFYLGRAYVEVGDQGLTQVFILRCIMGPFAHPLFTACTGIGLGLAVAVMRSAWSRVAIALIGYAAAAMLHAIWNLSAVTGHIVGVYLAFQVPLFLGFLGLVIALRVHEGRVVRRYLNQYADAGWLSYEEVAMLSSLPYRRSARAWAKQSRGAAGEQAMRAFQDTASDLALLRARIVRGSAEAAAPQHEGVLLDALVANRQAFLFGLPPGAPGGVA